MIELSQQDKRLLAALKQDIVREFAPVSSAVLLDPETGVGPCLSQSVLPGGTGLLVALDTGAFVLAFAGLLRGYQAVVHYEHSQAFHELFPDTSVGFLPVDLPKFHRNDLVTGVRLGRGCFSDVFEIQKINEPQQGGHPAEGEVRDGAGHSRPLEHLSSPRGCQCDE